MGQKEVSRVFPCDDKGVMCEADLRRDPMLEFMSV